MVTWYCRVCGLDYDESPWGPNENAPDHSICECCGAEFGYHDHTPASTRQYRATWLANGALWFYPKLKPEGWLLAEQLEQIPDMYL
ncbi:hypothetical protein [Hymenobacter volaticus]|uniref:Rubredoxin-like domain-containing protein n=1 Tax=Hymenobacter volaticus TaxID=2932254 RepID=A0ABY4G261_9BACT|nr:hypothetical protein [Hymenobacter volaticus]UOQ64960.1 hypothetical protein MUN86_15490 [Hymenobacter volaticus]